MLTLARTPDVAAAEESKDQQQYAVVLVNEEQLDRLLRKQRAQVADPRLLNAGDMYERYARLKRRLAATVVLGVAAVAVLVAWNGASGPLLASLAFMADAPSPGLPTGASFSVSAATPTSSDAAGEMARRISRLGLPAFVRVMPDGRTHQVLVGPYAYLDEAEGAQRRLDALGFGRGRLFVDDGLRAIGNAGAAASRGEAPGLLLIGAAERVALVFEMEEEAARPTATRLGDTGLGLDLGPSRALRPLRLAAPEGVTLLRDVAIEEIVSEDGTRRAYARLTFPASARATVRTGDHRMYVDLAWPQDFDEPPARTGSKAAAQPEPAVSATGHSSAARQAAAEEAAYDDAIRPIRLRFEEVSPFVLTSARMAPPEVLAALEQTVASLDASLSTRSAPASRKEEYDRLQAAIRAARLSMSAEFTGDRLAQAHEAMAIWGKEEGRRAK